MIKNFRNLLALLLAVIVIPGMWVLYGMSIINVPEVIIGATISIETLVAQFYFRKKPDGEVNGS